MTTFAQLEQQKAEMTAAVEGWSEARLAYRPEPGGWSTTEMLDHIVKVESEILTAARKGVQTPHRIGIRDRAGFLVLKRIFQSERRVKVPAAASRVLPDEQPNLSGILDRWTTVRQELAAFLGQLSSGAREAGIFRHPISGWMNMQQILEFYFVHIVHHGFQLARLRAGSNGL